MGEEAGAVGHEADYDREEALGGSKVAGYDSEEPLGIAKIPKNDDCICRNKLLPLQTISNICE